jgi:ubiquinone/menaquinone biosynthesis C-methylase UbiE
MKRPSMPEHLAAIDTDRLISLLPIRRHEQVAQIGCNDVSLVISLAKFLREGGLHVLDSSSEIVAGCRKRVEETRLSNTQVIHWDGAALPFEPNSLDGVLMAFMLEKVADPHSLLQSVAGLLRPGGWCAVLGWFRREMDEGPPLKMRVSRKKIHRLAKELGLLERWTRDLNGKHYAVQFAKQTEN